MAQIRIPFEKFELSEKDGATGFIAESLSVGKYNGFNITLEELTKAAPGWVGMDVLLGHSDDIIGEITHSAIEGGKLIQKGTLDDLKVIALVKKGKLKPSIGAASSFEKRPGGIYATEIKPDHLALVRNPACKTCSVRINEKWVAMTEKNQDSFIKSFRTASDIEVISLTEEQPIELKAKHEIELKDLKLKHESEIKGLNLKLESTEKELKTYKEAEKLAMAEKLTGTEIRLGRLAQDKRDTRIEEVKKLELADIQAKYTLALEELTEKVMKYQGRLPVGEGANLNLEKQLDNELLEMQNKMNHMAVV